MIFETLNNQTEKLNLYLWLISDSKRLELNDGKFNLSLSKGLASISFLSSINIILRANFVCLHLDSCLFLLEAK